MEHHLVSSPRASTEPSGFLLTRILATALRHRVLVLSCALAAFAFVAAGLFTKRQWTSTSAFVTQSTSKLPGNLSGLAAQFGVSLPTGSDATQSPIFYAEMLKSRTLLEQLAATPFAYRDGNHPVRADLFTIHEAKGTELERREKLMKILARDVDVNYAPRTGIVRVSVTAPDPVLARDMNTRLLELLSLFNTNVRQSQAGAERKYAQTQLEDARAQLRVAEERLEAFQQANASYNFSERLKLEAARLQREVNHRQSLFSALAQAYEQARLDEVRETPAISIVEQPEIPALPKPRRIAVRAPLALILGGIVGLLFAMLIEVARSLPSADPAGFDIVRTEVRRALRLVRRQPGSPRP